MGVELLFRAHTYECDRPLFKELGLKPFEFDIREKERHFVGRIRRYGADIRIWVNAHPAQFWEFRITCKDPPRKYLVTTGSGSLSDYWATIRLLAEDMLVVKMDA